MRVLVLVMLASLGFTQCKTKTYTLDTLPKAFITLGNYGGFTGASSTFYLFPNGQRFMKKGVVVSTKTNTTTELTQVSSRQFKKKLKELKKMNFWETAYTKKGNLTHFVRLKTKKADHTISWSNPENAPQQVVSFYNALLREMKTDLNQQ